MTAAQLGGAGIVDVWPAGPALQLSSFMLALFGFCKECGCRGVEGPFESGLALGPQLMVCPNHHSGNWTSKSPAFAK
jgi:hypothetical protein